MPYKDSNPTYNVNRKVANFGDFTSNIDAEKEKLKKVKRSFTPNSDRQQFVRNSRTEYNPVTHKLTDYTEGEVEDKIKAIEELEDTNENFDGNLVKKSIDEIIDDILSKFEFSEKGNDEMITLANYLLSPSGPERIAQQIYGNLKKGHGADENGFGIYTSNRDELKNLEIKLKR
jgi:hypothetical protein